MDSGLPPLVQMLKMLVESLAICGKSDFFQEISEHGIFHGITGLQENKPLIIKDKKGLLIIEWE